MLLVCLGLAASQSQQEEEREGPAEFPPLHVACGSVRGPNGAGSGGEGDTSFYKLD